MSHHEKLKRMIDERRIEEAFKEYNEKIEKELSKRLTRKPTSAERYADTTLRQCAFYTGAKWMQEELLKDLWHPASKKPLLRNGKCLVVYNSGKVDIFSISFVYEMLSNYGKDGMDWKYWAYVSDLFPKEGGEQ